MIDIFTNPGRNPVQICVKAVRVVWPGVTPRHRVRFHIAVHLAKSVWGQWESHCFICSLSPPASVYHTCSCANATVYDFALKLEVRCEPS